MKSFREFTETEELDEVLDVAARRKKAIQMKRIAPKLKMARLRASRKVANQEKLKSRARRQAINTIVKKLSKNVPKSEMSAARKMDIEKRVSKMGSRVDKLAKKLLPKIRKAELERKRGQSKDQGKDKE